MGKTPMTDVDRLIDEIEAGLESTEPDDWLFARDNVGKCFEWCYQLVNGTKDNGWYGTTPIYISGKNEKTAHVIAEHIARCNPANMNAIIDAYRAMKAELEGK